MERARLASLVMLVVVDGVIGIGGAGMSGDTPLAEMYTGARSLRLADGPDEVHLGMVARAELKPYLDVSR